VKDH
jgi:hypothetical protein